MKLFICSFFILFTVVVQAEVIDITSNDFSEIRALYDQEADSNNKALLVFDMDDTLLTMSQPLGGVGWWDWQSNLLATNPTSDKLVANNFIDLLKVQNFLFSMVKMSPTDESVVPFLQDLSKQSVSAMVLTARSPDLISTTMVQFEENGFVDEQKQLVFKTTKPQLLKSATNEAGVFNCPELNRKAYYNQGMLFVSGGNKGKALHCILKNAKKKFKTVLFVDDASSNSNAVRAAFMDDTQYKVFNILYSREHAKEALFLGSAELQTEVDAQWKNIKNVIGQNIKQPRIPNL